MVKVNKKRSGIVKPENLSPAEFMKWRHKVVAKRGQSIFNDMGIPLPDEFEEVSEYQQGVFNDSVEQAISDKSREMRSQDEGALARKEFDFVSEDDWSTLQSGSKFEGNQVRFKEFRGRNYDMEYVISPPDVVWHIFYPSNTMMNKEVMMEIHSILKPFVPRQWRVSLSFESKVSPYSSAVEGRGDDVIECCSYSVKFHELNQEPGAAHIMTQILNEFLQKFVMMVHAI